MSNLRPSRGLLGVVHPYIHRNFSVDRPRHIDALAFD